MATNQTTEQSKKRKRLTLEEQIAKQKELLAKEQESLEKKQKRLRSLNASKMNKDRKESQKKRNSMLIQLGLYFMTMFDNKDKDYIINGLETLINSVKRELKNIENNFNIEDEKANIKLINNKKILIEALENMKENYLKYGEVKIKI